MPEHETKQSAKDRLKEITDSIEKGIKELFESDKYKAPEKEFSDSHNDAYLIYQLKTDESTAHIRFMGTEFLERKGFEIVKDNYIPVYTGELMKFGSTHETLNHLYEIFNIAHPQDFTGHSLSVSDIVALKQSGEVTYHYVDTYGFKDLPDFGKPENALKNAEMQIEDDYGMIDGIINNGSKQSEQEQKPSVLEKLRRPTEEHSQKSAAHKKSAEMEI